jgi:type VI protein secretion system component Hcp
MRILTVFRWAFPACLLLAPGSPVRATSASTTPAVYACFGSGTLSANPRANGCPVKSGISLLESISLGGSDVVTITGSGAGAGKPSFQAISIAKGRDATSDALLKAASAATVLPEVAIAVYESGGKTPAYNILLTNVTITSWQWSASGSLTGGNAEFGENLSLKFTKFALIDNATGKVVTWNLANNAPTVVQ